MLDEDTIEVMLGPGTMPGTERTQELPVISVEEPHELPPHLAHDPILTMEAPKATTPSLFDHTFGHRPTFYPARPHKAPRIPARPRDHVLAGLTIAVVAMGIATVMLVESGFNSGLPQSEQERLHPSPTLSVPDESMALPDPSSSAPGPVTSSTASPSHIPAHVAPVRPVESISRRRLPIPATTPSRPLQAPSTGSVSPSPSLSPSVSPTPSQSPSASPSASSSSGTPSATPSSPTATATPSSCPVLCVQG